jgi:hypothetical protein
MAVPTDITTGVQTVTATGAVAPTTGLAISGYTGDVTLCLEVTNLSQVSGTASARIQFEDSTNGFTAATALWVFDVPTGTVYQASTRVSKRKYELPNNQFGVSSAVIRVNVTALAGTTPSLSLHAWLES